MQRFMELKEGDRPMEVAEVDSARSLVYLSVKRRHEVRESFGSSNTPVSRRFSASPELNNATNSPEWPLLGRSLAVDTGCKFLVRAQFCTGERTEATVPQPPPPSEPALFLNIFAYTAAFIRDSFAFPCPNEANAAR
jgi:hypothetical protein